MYRAGGCGETRESESQNRSWGGKMGSDGEKGESDGERAQHKRALSCSGLFVFTLAVDWFNVPGQVIFKAN